MRILLIIAGTLLVFSENLSAQNDFLTLDKKSYDFYSKGDYKNLEKTADTMFSRAIDYYYLRFRLGTLAYNKQLYSSALKHFSKALSFNSFDTIAREYIYYSYLLSGRKSDADLYLKSIPDDKKNAALKLLGNPVFSPLVYFGASASGYNITLYTKHYNSFYEAIKSNISMNAGFESYFLNRFKGTINYTNFHKYETYYTSSDTSGQYLNLVQNQIYFRLAGYVFPGWEFSVFDHSAFYSDIQTEGTFRNRQSIYIAKNEYNVGVGISKNGWKIRGGANFSLSNFSSSNQVRGEGYLTYLPYGNLNLYFTTGGMYQNDIYWGGTYQINEEIGLKVYKFLWFELGIINGNSFLYARNQGSFMNNSYLIPATSIYGNFIILPGKRLVISMTPFFNQNYLYSWNLSAYTKTDRLISNSAGASIKITFKIK